MHRLYPMHILPIYTQHLQQYSLFYLMDPHRTTQPTETHHANLNNDNNINTNTITTNPKIYRPKLASQYIEPDTFPDLLDGMALLYKTHGSSLRHHTSTLPPRDDIITFNPHRDQQELDNNIKWHQCPEALRYPILDITKSYWDVFCEEGLRRNIRGYTCRIDTGDISPVCCKPLRYGPHESIIMNKLGHQLQQNGLIKDDDGPWGALIVLAAKHGQENTPWHDYIWRLCVSY
jgi:hypothetical protein